ncbi:MBL fold metallo-hydrolase [Actinomadura sp. LD22]|uniref:MBL fold metallo-hydrolase n=1 Tax=Actinomadura physcomitrii TaxID=2650748 RepID=A0A6I4MFF8_9ACTN|nr:MBL fold metallo-hydrolase [Actinomadura physcomitrii]MWA03305.1 MBL fold metallo-hydrolase [Actinomadura physcomitrii]
MIVVEVLAVRGGDCLWIEWEDLPGGRRRRMLVDGGPGGAKSFPPALKERFDRQPESERDFELVVCTHIDDDHIGGLLALLTSPPPGFSAREVWFNSMRHLDLARDVLGPRSGAHFERLLTDSSIPWNVSADGGAIVVPDDGAPPVFELPGLSVTLLSPTRDGLRRLADVVRGKWPKETGGPGEKAADTLGGRHPAAVPWRRLAAAQYTPDSSKANDSSVAFCLEHADGSRVLCGADAHAETLVRSLHRLQSSGRYRVDLCKLPHHGSAGNVSPAFVDALDCGHWLVSTEGGHVIRASSSESAYRQNEGRNPSMRAMARIFVDAPRPPTFWFNHRGDSTERYEQIAEDYGFRVRYPDSPGGIAVEVRAGRVSRAKRP